MARVVAFALCFALWVHGQATPCSPNPCLNGGVCTDARSPTGWVPFTCDCAMGFDGITCEIPALIAVVFSSNMVLQRAPKQAVVFGAANATVPGDQIALVLEGVGAWSATADASGAWRVVLPPQGASTVGTTLTATSKSTGRAVSLANVVFGDVYVCAGQSNMALSVSSGYLPLASAAVAEAEAPRYQLVRLVNNGNFWPWYASEPGSTPVGSEAGNPRGFRLPTAGNGTWQSPGTIANFSAACWFFGSSLFDALGGAVPVGLIDNSAGGTSIHLWSSPDAVARCSQVTPSSNVTAGGVGVLFDAMIAPLSPMALSGITWFQGESNACGYSAPGAPCGGAFYACQLRAMIEDWRAKLLQPALPFLVTELGALTESQWPNMRAAQQAAVAGLAGAATVPNHDLGWANDMHSRRKVVLGWRLRMQMLAMASSSSSNGSVAWRGPELESVRFTVGEAGVSVALTFSAATSAGLHLNGTGDCAYGQPAGFACCGAAGSPVFLRVANASAADGSGWTWHRAGVPAVAAGTVTATLANTSAVDLTRVRLSTEGFPTCALYNGVGGPDDGGVLVAEPWDVVLDSLGRPSPAPVPACSFPCPIAGFPLDCCGPQP